jgi:DNA-binding LacI/PurR family transcriptional regulator
MMARVTLQTIADAVGVSRMTVSNAFSRPAKLSQELRERILAVADDLGYVGPDPAARALARGTTGVVGVLFSTMMRNVFAEEVTTAFLGALADGLSGSGLSLALLTTDDVSDWIPVRDVPMDATLVFTWRADEAAMGWLRKRRLPLVLVDQQPLPGIAAVNVDDRGGARLAAEHLVALGHRRVGIVTVGMQGPYGLRTGDPVGESSTPESYITGQRILGWREGLSGAGVQPLLVIQPKMPYRPEIDGYAALMMLLDADPGITAVLCFSDRFAAGVLAAAHDRGLIVPDDLSVIGFDDSPVASNSRPALTTVRQDLTRKGHAAAERLIATVKARSALPAELSSDSGAAETTDAAEHVVLPVELVVRDSTAPPKASLPHSRTTRHRKARVGPNPRSLHQE